MNTLTKNRIIQEGDEYRDNGKWKPVPKDDFGLQVMFSKYAEVRRPSEAPPKTFPVLKNETSSESHPPQSVRKAATSEGVKRLPSASTVSGVAHPEHAASGGETLSTTPAQIDEAARLAHAVSHLPTVVSKKAHKRVPEQSSDNQSPESLGETPETVRPTEVPQAGSVSPKPLPEIKPCPNCGNILCGNDPCVLTVLAKPSSARIEYPNTAPSCIWTGRNGTFRCRAINLHGFGDVIQIIPEGKRGEARNAVIEFPASCTKQIIASLEALLTNK